MINHPFNQSNRQKIIGLLLTVAFISCLVFISIQYVNTTVTTSIIYSVFYISTLSFMGYFYWYIIDLSKNINLQIIITLIVQITCLIITSITLYLSNLFDIDIFLKALPIFLIIGVLAWIILLQWYDKINIGFKLDDEIPNDEIDEINVTNKEVQNTNVNALDRISVKNGTQIHIIKTKNIVYIQAYGDYVLIYTNSEKYIKETTMKYLEANLPEYFIRIHRSYIVNTNCISRVELFGKETYQIFLKNSIYLKVSINGYKLLKQKLML